MKKVLAAVLAAAMSLGVAATAFAAETITVTAPTGTSLGQYDFTIDQTLDSLSNKSEIKVDEDRRIYTYDDAEWKFLFYVSNKDVKVRADVGDGKIAVNTKRVSDTAYAVTVKAKWGVRDFKNDYDWTVELDVNDNKNKNNATILLKGKGGYSDTQIVNPGDRLTVSKSEHDSITGKDGAIFDFSEIIDEEARIRCNPYVDVYFKGNYGTDKENMRVVTDNIDEVEKYFDDTDVDYYDFVGTPKFATKVKVLIDGDPNAYLYEYNKSTGDLTKVDAEYTSDGWSFTTKTLGTYVLTEEEYDEGNVDKEDVDNTTKEPVSTPDEKTNPGTGANDMVGVAAALAVVSLVAAGAVAFKKASK
ncbi:MAG: hypothetical protein HFG27_06670 [Provencibacterium sp.]|nr:hypothetical protein [Provencibacterium sp.]